MEEITLKERVKAFINRIRNFYVMLDTLEQKMFWCLSLTLFGIAVVSAIGTALEHLGTTPFLMAICSCIVPVIIMYFCYLTRKYVLCSVLIYMFISCILMPATFLFNGGFSSGMPMYLLACAVMCAIFSEIRLRLICFSCYIAVNLGVFFFANSHPEYVTPIRDSFVNYDVMLSFFITAIGIGVVVTVILNEYKKQRSREINNGIIDILGTVVEFRDGETGNHVRNIKGFTRILLKTANEIYNDINFSEEEIDTICSAAVLHDIGKIAVPDSILLKPGRLTKEEFEIIKEHPVNGCHIIESMEYLQDSAYYHYCYEICRHHHERYDGKGYPDGLKGNEIPFVSQIVAMADVYDALSSNRVYKDVMEADEVYGMIIHGEAGAFSDRMLYCFSLARAEMEAFANRVD